MSNIPGILHYAWFGPRPLPDAYRAYIAGWRRLSSGWAVMAWTERDLDWSSRYVNEAYATRGWTRLADYMRVHALHRFGGFYLDTDVELIRRLDPLRDAQVVLGFQSRERTPSWVNNAVIGATPQHPFIARWLRAFDDRMPGWRRMGDAHGPGLVTRLLEAEGLGVAPADAPRQIGDVTLLPPDRFYPYPWTAPYTPDCVTPDTFAVHHWGGGEGGHRPLTPVETVRALSAMTAPRLAAAVMHRRLEAERRRAEASN
jgi:hypothetical protein